MKDSLYIKSRFDNICLETKPTTEEAKLKYQAKLQILNWIYNDGNIRSEEELRTQIRNCEDELKCFEFMHTTGLPVEIANAKLYELKLIIE